MKRLRSAFLTTVARAVAVLLVFLVALPVVVPSGCSPGPAWVQGFESPGFLGFALGAVLVSFALGFRNPPLMPQALLHLGLLVILFGGAASVLQRQLGVLELAPGQSVNRYESTSGPRLLPFSLLLHGSPLPPAEAPSSRPAIVPAKIARRALPGTHPFPGRLLVQWPARSLSVRLPVRVGDAPLLVPPGESPTPSNAFRLTFVRLVPDFVMDPTTHEVSGRSDQPANPALFVRETGPGYTLERWLFAKFPELAMHQEAEHAAKTSPLRLRYESDATESPALPTSIASAKESEPEVLAAWSGSSKPGAASAPGSPATDGAPTSDIAGSGPVAARISETTLIVSIIDHGRPGPTNHLDARHPLCFGGYRLQPLIPDPKRPGAALVKVEQPVGSAWVSSGVALAVIASLFHRRANRRHADSFPA